MSERLLNIATKYKNGLVANIDEENFFQLKQSVTSRTDLYNFAIALAVAYGDEPRPISATGKQESFTRENYVQNYVPLYTSLLFATHIKDDIPNRIDEINDTEKIFDLIEEYANTGFAILEELKNEVKGDSELLFYKLLNELDRKYAKYFPGKYNL